MAAILFFIFLAGASLYVFSAQRHALLLILLIGFSQDMVRKLTPGEPIIFIVTVGLLFGAVLLGIWARSGFVRSLEPFLGWTQSLRDPLLIFLLILFAQFAYSLVQYGNVIVASIGLITYIAPFLAVIVGYAMVRNLESIRGFLKVYVVFGLAVAASVVLSFMGSELTVLNEVGSGLKIYDQGTVLKSHAGIMRTGEVAAWHISSTACLIFALAVTSDKPRRIIPVLIIIGLLLIAVSLTGRRKMLMLTVLFLIGFFVASLYYRKTLNPKYFIGILVFSVVCWFGYEFFSLASYNDSLRDYIARGSTTFNDASGRFVQLGINPIQWAYNRVGLLGGGLGIASQGSYLFNLSDVAGGAGEGGLGKVMVELGLPGLLCGLWLLVALASHVDKGLKLSLVIGVDSRLLPLMLSLAILLTGNAVTFSVATQVYGDIFILIMLGLMGGFIFALPKIASQSLQLTQQYENASLVTA